MPNYVNGASIARRTRSRRRLATPAAEYRSGSALVVTTDPAIRGSYTVFRQAKLVELTAEPVIESSACTLTAATYMRHARSNAHLP